MTNSSSPETGSGKFVIPDELSFDTLSLDELTNEIIAALSAPVDDTLRSCFEVPRMNYPRVGAIVHYVARGSADGVFKPVCRAAIIADVPVDALPPAENYSHEISSDDLVADLVVLNPAGMFFNRCVQDDERRAGTWHTLDYCDS